MEESNIVYTGITQAASDLDCADGDLSLSHNLVSQNGAMRAIVLPDAAFTLGEGERLVYIHSASGYKNYLYEKEGLLKAFMLNEAGERVDYDFSYVLGSGNTIRQIQSVGNTLIVFTGKDKAYILYKSGDYVTLGNEIPEVYLQFGLTGRTRLFSYSDESKSMFRITFDEIYVFDNMDLTEATFSESNQVKITEQIMAKVNKFMSEQVTEKGYFCFPFFVRYALRLYDGTLVRHSAPVLMMPSTTTAPIVILEAIGGEELHYSYADLDIMLVAASLNYRILPSDGAPDLKNNWGDIVKSIDIFVSPPIYTYDTGGLCKSFNDTDNFDTAFIGKLIDFDKFRGQDSEDRWEDAPYLPLTGYVENDDGTYSYPFKGVSLEYTYNQLYSLMYNKERKSPVRCVKMPEKETDKLREDILNQSLFYYVKKIEVENMEWFQTHELEIEESYLKNLTLKEQMTDDWQSHDVLSPSYTYMYNQRLNMANLKRTLFDGFPALAMFCKKDAVHNFVSDPETHELNINPVISAVDMDIYTYINEDNRDIVVRSSFFSIYAPNLADFVSYEKYKYNEDADKWEATGEYQRKSWPPFVFYPNPNAYKMVWMNALGSKYEIELKEYDSLNGAYALLDFDSVLMTMGSVQVPTVSLDKSVEMPNKIYTSEVGNPFYFPLGGINTVGVGEIRGISSTTRALSQGQFGQFPLLVFATDGIWAMEVSDTGLYSVKQPMSRDVCTNPQSITQTDGAVVFVSDKGLMVVDGSNVDLLSAELDGPSFDPLTVDRLGDVLAREGLQEEVGSQVSVKDFLAGCRIAYDYPNARLVLFREGSPYAYVYSLNSRTWATMSADFVTEVTDYPNSYLQRETGEVVNISQKQDYDDTSKEVRTFLLSRPMKLGDDALKTVNMVINRGHLRRSGGAVVVFASHDGMKYVPIGSAVGYRVTRLQGSPYRYFRVAVVRDMHIGESLAQTSVYFTRKWRNKPR